MGAFFFLLASLLAAANHFQWRGKGLLATAKNLTSDGYLALQNICYYDLVYMPIYRENYPLMEPYQGRPLHGLLVGLGVPEVPPKAPYNPCPIPAQSFSQSGP